MPESWTDYNFPDPTLCAPYLPYAGLCKAINERARAVGNSEDIIQVPDFFSMKEGSVSGWLYEVDRAIFELDMVNFVNPDKYDELGENSDVSEMLWTWEDLLLAGADWVEEDVIDLTANPSPKLQPNWSAKWAKQRYKMLNLLRYGVIGFNVEWITGHSGYNDTKREAYQNAYASVTQRVGDYIGSSFLGYDDTVHYDAIYAMVEQCRKFYPIPQISGLIDFWAVGFAQPDSDGEIFNPLGSGISYGWNKLKSVNGYFINETQNYPYPSGWDSVSGNYQIGWMLNNPESDRYVLCYADFNPVFNFKEEEA